jgi:hypothetical protein
MGTEYTSTIEVSVWKEHTCVACANKYRYLFRRTISGSGGSAEKAEREARKTAVNSLEHEADMQPCPECGLYQPDMIAAQRSGQHWLAFWALPSMASLIFILAMCDLLNYATSGIVLAVSALGVLLWNVLIDRSNPNADLAANRELAAQRIEEGDLANSGTSDESTSDPGTGVGSGHLFGYLLILAAVFFFFAPIGLRTVEGMATNANWVPEVVGPGDNAYVYFADSVSSVKGYWSANVLVNVTNWEELGLPNATGGIVGSSKTDSWSNTIRVKSTESL